jgi:hypothetical protein
MTLLTYINDFYIPNFIMTEFSHLGFKIVCSVFMARTVYHYMYRENYMNLKYNLKVQKFEQENFNLKTKTV